MINCVVGNKKYNLSVVKSLTEEWRQFHNIQRYSLFGQSPNDPYDPHYQDFCGLNDVNRPLSRMHLLLKVDGKGVGITTLDICHDRSAVTRGVAIHENMRGDGHGRALGNLVEQFARALGVQALHVNADPEKTGYYKKIGFREHVWSEEELQDWKSGKFSSPIPTQMTKKLV